jgi:hypothetical protein
MQKNRTPNSSGLRKRFLSGTVGQLADDIREAATECHSAIPKLALRGEVDPNLLVQFAQETNEMLTAVTRIKNYLLPIDARIRKLSNESEVRHYFKIIQILDNSQASISTRQRQSLEREREMIAARASRTLRQLREDVRTLLVFRLEMTRYWRWFLKKAIEIYTTFKGIVRESLRKIYGEIRDPVLRELVAAALSSENEFPTELFKSAQQRLSTTLTDLEHQAMKELDDLSMIESRLREVKDSAAELETGEAVIREEIRRSIPKKGLDEAPINERTVLRGLDLLEKAEDTGKPPRVFVVRRPEE